MGGLSTALLFAVSQAKAGRKEIWGELQGNKSAFSFLRTEPSGVTCNMQRWFPPSSREQRGSKFLMLSVYWGAGSAGLPGRHSLKGRSQI